MGFFKKNKNQNPKQSQDLNEESSTKHKGARSNKAVSGKSKKKGKRKENHGIKQKKPSIILQAPASIMWPRLLMIVSVIFLCVIGLVFVYSASSVKGYVEDGDATSFVLKQMFFMCVAVVFCLVLIKLKYTFFNNRFWSSFILIFTLAGLLLVSVVGVAALGAERAIYIGSFAVQPAEFAKITLILFLAHIISDFRANNISRNAMLGLGFGSVAITLVLVAKQPDMGTFIILCIGILVLVVLGGIPLIIIAGILGLVVLCALVLCFAQPYHLDRIRAVIDPYSDPDGSGYQLIHSLYAFGTGGFWGTGLGASRQKYLYLPEAHTDFIYAIIGEEAGFIGAFLVLLAFAVFVWAGFKIASAAPDIFGCLTAGSLTAIIGFQACVNMACVVGLAPITGKPLPFISYGGSSLISSLSMVGLILSVSFQSRPDKHYERKRDKFVIFSKKKKEGSSNAQPKISKSATEIINGLIPNSLTRKMQSKSKQKNVKKHQKSAQNEQSHRTNNPTTTYSPYKTGSMYLRNTHRRYGEYKSEHASNVQNNPEYTSAKAPEEGKSKYNTQRLNYAKSARRKSSTTRSNSTEHR